MEPLGVFVDPARPAVVYVWVRAKGVFRSEDGGKAWTSAGAGLPATTLSSLTVDPSRSCVVHAGTEAGHVLTSMDCGRTWTTAARGLDGVVSALAVSPADGAVYAGTSPPYLADGVEIGGGAVYRSADGRVPWARRSSGLTGWYVSALETDATAAGRVLAATEHGPFRTQDGAATWAECASGPVAVNPLGLAVYPADPRVVFAAVERGIAVSRDGGRTWQDALDVRGTRVRVGPLLAVPGTPATIYAVKGSLARPKARWTLLASRDAGRTWATAGALPTQLGSLVADPSRPGTLYGIGGYPSWPQGGIFKSVDRGRSWRRIYSAARKPPASALAVDPFAPNVLYDGLVALGKPARAALLATGDGGRTWRPLRGFGPGYVTALSADPRRRWTLYAVSYRSYVGQVRVSGDRGRTWAELGRSPSSASPLLVDPVRPGVVYAGTQDGVYLRGGDGRWRRAGPVGSWIRGLATDAKARRLYAVVSGGGVASAGLPLPAR